MTVRCKLLLANLLFRLSAGKDANNKQRDLLKTKGKTELFYQNLSILKLYQNSKALLNNDPYLNRQKAECIKYFMILAVK